jgi:hypothetical protein
LQTQNSPWVHFTGKSGTGIGEKFVLVFHQQNQHPGISVDIISLAGSFLCMDKDNYVVENSRTPPTDKFLILPVGMQ